MIKKLLAVLTVLVLSGCGGGALITNEASSPQSASKGAVAERMVAYFANIRIGISGNDSAEKQIADKTRELKGYVAEESEKSMIVHVPAEKLDEFIEYLGDHVGKILSKSKSGRDVTDSHADNSAELAALVAARDQYSKLLKQASAVDEILKIEKELERVNAAILKLEQQIKRTERSVEYSRVTIEFERMSRFGRTLSVIVPAILVVGGFVLLIG
jgi:ribosomal protein S11